MDIRSKLVVERGNWHRGVSHRQTIVYTRRYVFPFRTRIVPLFLSFSDRRNYTRSRVYSYLFLARERRLGRAIKALGTATRSLGWRRSLRFSVLASFNEQLFLCSRTLYVVRGRQASLFSLFIACERERERESSPFPPFWVRSIVRCFLKLDRHSIYLISSHKIFFLTRYFDPTISRSFFRVWEEFSNFLLWSIEFS